MFITKLLNYLPQTWGENAPCNKNQMSPTGFVVALLNFH